MPRKRLIKILVALVALACLAYASSGYLGEIHRIAQARWLGVVGMIAVHVLTLWVQSLGVKFGLDAFDHPVTERESFCLFVASSCANLFVPRSGVGTTAIYLNRVRQSSMIDYSSVVLYNAGLFVLACSTVACLVCGMDWLATGGRPPLYLLIGLPILLGGSAIAVTVRWTRLPHYRGPGASLLNRMAHASQRLAHSGNVYRMGLIHFVLVVLRALRLQIAFWAMHVDVGFFPVLLASVIGDLTFAIAVTPSALGFREAAITLVAAKLGTPISIALSVAVFDRLVFSLTVIVLAQLLLVFAVNRPDRQSVTPAPSAVTGGPVAAHSESPYSTAQIGP